MNEVGEVEPGEVEPGGVGQALDKLYDARETRLKNIKNVKGCRDGMPKSMQTR